MEALGFKEEDNKVVVRTYADFSARIVGAAPARSHSAAAFLLFEAFQDFRKPRLHHKSKRT